MALVSLFLVVREKWWLRLRGGDSSGGAMLVVQLWSTVAARSWISQVAASN